MEDNHRGAPSSQDPPPYSEKQPSISDQQPVDGPAPPMGFVANPAMPYQYQAYNAPYGVVPGQGPITQAPQHMAFIVPVQPTHEPDYLGYAIFTMLCCCLPLGIAALVYSIQVFPNPELATFIKPDLMKHWNFLLWTREANRIGNGIAARESSRLARIFAHTALGVGLVFFIIYIVFFAVGF